MELPVSYKTLRSVQYCVEELHDICFEYIPDHLIGNIDYLENMISTAIDRYLILNPDIEIISEHDHKYQNFEDFDEIYTWNMFAAIQHLEFLLDADDYVTSPTLVDDITDALEQAKYIDTQLHKHRSLKRKLPE